jgi:hypothetical protein
MSTTIAITPDISSSLYDQTILTKDADGNVTDILFSGLEVKLSDLVKQFPFSGGNTLSIYADSLVADIPNFNAKGTVIVARTIDISSLGGESWPVNIPNDNIPSVVECLISNSVIGIKPATLGFITNDTPGLNPTPLFVLPTNSSTLQIGTFTVSTNGDTQGKIGNSIDFNDLVGRPFALNSFYAIFAKATDLINSGNSSDLNQAKDLLNWICSCIKNCNNIPSTHIELFGQASSLFVSLNIPENYHFLDVLSSSYFETQINQFLNAAEAYDLQLAQLKQESTDQNIIQTISSGLFNSAKAEIIPSTVELNQLNNNLNGQYTEIIKIANAFNNQVVISETKSALLKASIKNAQIQKFLIDGTLTAIDVVKSGVSIAMAVAKEGEGTGEAISNVAETFQKGYETITDITQTFDQGDLLTEAKILMTDSQNLLNNVLSSSQIWYQINNPKNNASTNFNPSISNIDPNLSWNNFMANVHSILSSLSSSLNENELNSAQDAANDYLASLEILANYGKALNANLIAYTNILCKAVVVKSKVDALNNVQDIWKELNENSQTEENKLIALQGLIQKRKDSTMRSLFLSWTMYRSAYLYNFLVEPKQTISLNSSIGDMKLAFANISSWVSGLPGESGNGTTILPNDDASLSLTIPVLSELAQAQESNNNSLVAYMVPASDSNSTTKISFNIPDIFEQFKGQIGSGDVAIWISSGEFFIDGIQANSSGFVPMIVSTSGHYINGYQDNLLQFISSPISSHFSYKPDSKPFINVPWKVNAEQYMLPTPFSLWTLEIDGSCNIGEVKSVTIHFKTNLYFKK